MLKNKFAAYALFVVLFVIFWNVCDYLYTTFITRGGYAFTPWAELGLPLIAAMVLGGLQFLRKPKE